MSTTATHPLAADYLRRLRAAARHLPADRLDDLCAEIESHLAEAIPPGASDADALEVIERLGPPREIVEAEQPRRDARVDEGPRTWREWAAIVLLALGGFVFGIGWLAGLVLLWSSRAWTLRDKLIGTLIVPGGLAAVVPALLIVSLPSKQICRGFAPRISPTPAPGRVHCFNIGGPSTLHTILGIALLVIVVVGPLLTAVYLARRAGSAPRTA
jgi:hypothetical protein